TRSAGSVLESALAEALAALRRDLGRGGGASDLQHPRLLRGSGEGLATRPGGDRRPDGHVPVRVALVSPAPLAPAADTEIISFSSLRASALKRRMPSASLSVAIASSLRSQRKVVSSSFTFGMSTRFAFSGESFLSTDPSAEESFCNKSGA